METGGAIHNQYPKLKTSETIDEYITDLHSKAN